VPSSTHTKCKPVTATVVVQEGTRLILGHSVAQIPAFGHLAAISKAKYGHRADHSRKERARLFKQLTDLIPEDAVFRTDEHKHYPVMVKRFFPNAQHLTHKGAKGSVSAQGELKKIGRDPLFSINHTLAMFRDKMSRLSRRSWNLSKLIERLDDHLAIYIESHNRMIYEKMMKKKYSN